jgi:hypothetical protein
MRLRTYWDSTDLNAMLGRIVRFALDKTKIKCGDKGKICAHREQGMLRTPQKSSLSNGPLRVRSKEFSPSIPKREAYVSCREYVSIPLRVWIPQIKVAPR